MCIDSMYETICESIYNYDDQTINNATVFILTSFLIESLTKLESNSDPLNIRQIW